MPRLRRAVVAALVAVGVLACSGCVDLAEMQFVKDHRLQFTAPDAYELVELPLEVTWTMEDFEVLDRSEKAEPTDAAGYYAVFVDRAPVKPGRTLADVGDGDPQCEDNPRCTSKDYLAAAGVYTTRKPSITLSLVNPLSSKARIQLHQVTVVLLDSEGRRIGEHAWFRQFKLENKVLDQ
ncbi:unannotated protein [freshwater metagenome]|uniref:Unannotated protein n=1 Tax=freshwater metagenome TaxID=449393 RepID=A0A6J6RC60_9ZZZZ